MVAGDAVGMGHYRGLRVDGRLARGCAVEGDRCRRSGGAAAGFEWGSSRTVWQIVAALRHARRTALDTGTRSQPPEMPAPHRPRLWHLAWTLTAVTTLTVFWIA